MVRILGINIKHHNNGTVNLTHPHLINSILKELGLNADSAKIKCTPAASSNLLGCHNDAPPHDGWFHYRCIISKLNYLKKSTHQDISYATHQCAHFSTEPKQPHVSIKGHMGFTVDFLPEGPDFPPWLVPSLTYLCTSTGKEYLLGLLKYYF